MVLIIEGLDAQQVWCRYRPAHVVERLSQVARRVSEKEFAQAINDFIGVAHLENGIELPLSEVEHSEKIVPWICDAGGKNTPGAIDPILHRIPSNAAVVIEQPASQFEVAGRCVAFGYLFPRVKRVALSGCSGSDVSRVGFQLLAFGGRQWRFGTL